RALTRPPPRHTDSRWTSDCSSRPCPQRTFSNRRGTRNRGGYAALYVPDHWAYERQGGGGLDDGANAWEATTILGAIAAVTSRARLGALVLCNLFRHPATTAQAIVTLDHLSGGRALLGIGSGWTKAEFEMMGVAFPDVKPRLRML